jgi:dihydroxyacetone kinase phosphotransfer subunit
MTVGIVVVSHSSSLAEGVKELAGQMSGGAVRIAAAGGAADGALGTDATRIAEAIVDVLGPDGALVLMDLGSAVMSAEVAVEMLPPDAAARVLLSNAPLVEGAVVATVESSVGKPLTEVESAAVRACEMRKVER